MRLLELRGGKIRGSIRFDGRELMECDSGELRRIRGKEIALVLQSPMSALNPALRIETQLREVWRAHSEAPWREAKESIASAAGAHGTACRRRIRTALSAAVERRTGAAGRDRDGGDAPAQAADCR